MLYCDPCAAVRGWPQYLMQSRATCELCGRRTICNCAPSSMLPLPRVEAKR